LALRVDRVALTDESQPVLFLIRSDVLMKSAREAAAMALVIARTEPLSLSY